MKRIILIILLPLVLILTKVVHAWPVDRETQSPPSIYIAIRFEGPVTAPILAIFPDGTILFSESYYFSEKGVNRPLFYTESRPDRGSSQDLAELVESLDPASDESLAEQFIRAYRAAGYDSRPAKGGNDLLEGQLEEGFLERLFDHLENSGALHLSIPDYTEHRPALLVYLWDDENVVRYSGVYGRFYTPGQDAFGEIPISDSDPDLAWRPLISQLLSSVEYLSADSLEVSQNFVSENMIRDLDLPPWLHGDIAIPPPRDGATQTSALDEETRLLLEQTQQRWNNGIKAEVLRELVAAARNASGVRRGSLFLKAGYYAIALDSREESLGYFEHAVADLKGRTDGVEARLRLGYLQLSINNRRAALENFSRIAVGLVPSSTASQLEEAQLRTAMMLKAMPGQHERARTFLRHVALHSGDTSQSDYASLQLLGILFEEAKGDYYSIDSSRQTALLLELRQDAYTLSTKAGVSDSIRATAELMAGESYFYEDDMDRCYHTLLEFMANWKSIAESKQGTERAEFMRLITAAHTYAMISAFMAGMENEALLLSDQMDNSDYKAGDFYSSLNGRAYSLAYRSLYYRMKNQSSLSDQVQARLKNEFPEWHDRFFKKEEKRYRLR